MRLFTEEFLHIIKWEQFRFPYPQYWFLNWPFVSWYVWKLQVGNDACNLTIFSTSKLCLINSFTFWRRICCQNVIFCVFFNNSDLLKFTIIYKRTRNFKTWRRKNFKIDTKNVYVYNIFTFSKLISMSYFHDAFENFKTEITRAI